MMKILTSVLTSALLLAVSVAHAAEKPHAVIVVGTHGLVFEPR